MSHSSSTIRLALLAVAAVLVAVATVGLREKRQTIDATAQDIEARLAALDPVTRGGVIARLTSDAAKDIHQHAAH